VYLKNADATKLAQTLRSVVTSDGTAASAQQGNTSNLATNNQISQNNSGMNTGLGGNTQSGTTGGASLSNGPQQLSSGGAAGFIQADASTNTLILTCNEAVYRNLRAVIDQLDVRRAQVYIESLIVEVTSDKASEFGVQWLGATGSDSSKYRLGGLQSLASGTANNIGTLITGNTGNNVAVPGAGLSIGLFKQVNGALGLGAVAHTLETDGNANILSTPNMITLDNELATIRVGQNVPILTGQFTTTSGTNQNPFQTIDRKDVGLTLKVRPQISEGGTIKMAIYHETSSVASTGVSGITINTRVIENNVVADDGQIIVLGGLIEDSTDDDVEKVRGLGDIPVLGNLFKYQKRGRKKTNLMVFLRPVVVRNQEQSSSLAADRYDYMRAAERAVKPDDTILLKNLGQPMLPPLVNGQPVGGGQIASPVPPAPMPVRPGQPGFAPLDTGAGK